MAACFHGLFRTGASTWWVSRRLRAEGYATVAAPTLGYHVRPLAQCAESAASTLRELADRHPGAPIDVVTHSFGGIVLRAATALGDLPPVRRVVMLAPPNRGAVAARMAREAIPLHRLGWDPLAQVLPGAPDALPLPRAEVAVLAGGLGTARGFNPLLGADNDGTVRVDEAWLPGLADFAVVPVQHSLALLAPRTVGAAARFLAGGRLAIPA